MSLGIALGGVLVVTGVGAYVASEFASVTALIPAAFGAVFAGLGVIGRNSERRRVAAYVMSALAVLGVAGSLRGIPEILALPSGGTIDSVVAPVTQGILILICLVIIGAVGRDLLASE